MFRVVIAEIIKLWGTKILWLIAIGSLFPLAINTFGAINRNFAWETFYFFNWNTTHFLLGPIFFSLFIGYVFAREYLEKTINPMFTYPYKKSHFLIGKYFISLLMIFFTSLFSLIGTLLIGSVIITEPLTKDIILGMIKGNSVTILLQWLLVTPAMFFTIIGRSYIPAVIIGILAVVSSVMIMGTDYNMYFPYTAVLLMNQHVTSDVFETAKLSDMTISLVSIISTSIIFFVLSLLSFTKKDVHSG